MCSIENNPFLDRLQAFEEMAHSPSLMANCQDVVDAYHRDAKAYQEILAAFEETGFGLTLRNESTNQWTVILQDMSEPGRFRHQTFTERGFYGHHTMDSVEEVIEDAIDLGYRVVDNGRLEALCMTDEWAEGSRIGALIQQLNSGQINWGQFTGSANLHA